MSELLTRARGKRSLREMARLTGLGVMTIKRLEDGDTALPTKDNMTVLSEVYRVPLDDLARAAYGVLFEEVVEEVPDTADLVAALA